MDLRKRPAVTEVFQCPRDPTSAFTLHTHTHKKLNAGLLVALWLCLITTDEIFILSKSQNILEAAVLSLQGQTLAAVLLSHGLHHHPICKFAKNI